MNSFLDKLNLRPGERRLVVIVAIVVFAVLNIWLVWPSFGNWGKTEEAITRASGKLKMFDDELAKTNLYHRQMTELRQKGQFVGTDDQASQLQKEVTSQANLSGVQIQRMTQGRGSAGGRTNSFFEEQYLDIYVVAGETNLVEFLYNLGGRNALIRVRSMQIGRDPTGTKLQGSITLVESFQKKPPPKIALATPATSPAKPAAAPATKTKAATPAPKTVTPSKATPPKVTPPARTSKPGATPPATKPAKPVPSPAPKTPKPAKSTNVNWFKRLFSSTSGEAAA